MKRYYVIVKGQVQGVGFRWTAIQVANLHGYTGWIKNMYNGNVEFEIQGKDLDIYQYLQEIEKASYWIKINDYSQKEIAVVADEYSFRVR